LTLQLTPHVQAEERVLYPTVGNLLGAREATATMSRDHREIERLTKELGTLRSQLTGESAASAEVQVLRRVLYGLYALVEIHFAKVQDIYLPLLDTRLTAQEAQQMFQEMEKVAKAAQRSVAP
jgi:iron-sulfur cluster repair protein YtfE (RIC family)